MTTTDYGHHRPYLPKDEATNRRSLRIASNGGKWSVELENQVRIEVFEPLLRYSWDGGLGCDLEGLRRRMRQLFDEGAIAEGALSTNDFISRARRRRAGEANAAEEEGVTMSTMTTFSESF